MGYQNKTKEQLIELLEKKDSELKGLSYQHGHYITLYDKVPLGYQSLDANGCFLEVNQKWLNMLGYAPEDVIGKFFGNFLSPQYKMLFKQRFPEFIANGEIKTEFEMVCKNGETIFIAFDGKIGYDTLGSFQQTHCILKDISATKLAEKKLDIIRELLKETEKKGKIGGWVIDYKEMSNIWTDEVYRIHEVDEGFEPTFENTKSFYVPEFQPQIEKAFANVRKRGESFNLELEIITAKGNKKWINVIGDPVYENKKIIKARGSIQDITERKKAELSLKQSEDLYRILTENIKDVVWILDVDLKQFKYLSSSVEALSGFSPSEIIEAPFNNLFTPEFAKRFTILIGQRTTAFKASGKSQSEFYIDEAEQLCKDGSFIITEIISSFYINKETGHVEARGVTRDISDRKEAEKEIQRISQHYKALIEKASDGITLISSDGKFKYASPSALRIFGFSENEVNGMLPSDLTHPDELDLVHGELDKLLKEPSYRPTLEYRFKCKSGKWIWIESTFANLLADPNVNAIVINFRDITERKSYGEKVIEERNRAEQYINIANVMLLSLDKAGNVVLINKKGCQVLGYDEDEVLGLNWFDNFLPKNVRARVKKVSESVYSGYAESVKYFENTVLTKNGEQRLIAWHNSYLRDANGEIVGTLSSGDDITERKEQEFERQRLSEAVKQSANTIVITDTNGIIEFVNEKFSVLTGYTAEEAIGSNPRILNSGLQPKVYYSFMWQTIKSGKSWKGEFHNKRKDGSLFWEHVTISPLKDESGTIINFLAIKEDITQRKESEELLKQEKLFTNSIINSLPGIFYLYTYPELELVRWNKNHETILGYSEQELDHMRIKDWGEPGLQKDILDAIGKIIDNGYHEFEAPLIAKDGSLMPFILTGVSIELFGKPYIMGVGIDNAARKKAEEDLGKAKEKAEESDRLKSAFLANMSHEIRTPMNGILGFAGLLNDPDINDFQQKKYVKIIEKSGARMLSIINDIIDISKIESGQMNLYIKDTNINEQMNFIFAFFSPELEHKNIKFSLNKGLPDNKSHIKSDKEKIYAVLTNLVKNAIKFTDKGSLEFGYVLNKNMLEFYVKDTGKGISKEHVEIIFQRFRQGNESNTRTYEGAGLGLSISKAYVEMLGGNMWVESTLGKGSTFRFTLPYK